MYTDENHETKICLQCPAPIAQKEKQKREGKNKHSKNSTRKKHTPMHKQQRHRPLVPTPLMHKMHPHVLLLKPLNLNLRLELRQRLINRRFLFPPIELVFPDRGQPFYFGEGGAVVPGGGIEFVGEGGEGEFGVEEVKLSGWDGDGEGGYGGCHLFSFLRFFLHFFFGDGVVVFFFRVNCFYDITFIVYMDQSLMKVEISPRYICSTTQPPSTNSDSFSHLYSNTPSRLPSKNLGTTM